LCIFSRGDVSHGKNKKTRTSEIKTRGQKKFEERSSAANQRTKQLSRKRKPSGETPAGGRNNGRDRTCRERPVTNDNKLFPWAIRSSKKQREEERDGT